MVSSRIETPRWRGKASDIGDVVGKPPLVDPHHVAGHGVEGDHPAAALGHVHQAVGHHRRRQPAPVVAHRVGPHRPQSRDGGAIDLGERAEAGHVVGAAIVGPVAGLGRLQPGGADARPRGAREGTGAWAVSSAPASRTIATGPSTARLARAIPPSSRRGSMCAAHPALRDMTGRAVRPAGFGPVASRGAVRVTEPAAGRKTAAWLFTDPRPIRRMQEPAGGPHDGTPPAPRARRDSAITRGGAMAIARLTNPVAAGVLMALASAPLAAQTPPVPPPAGGGSGHLHEAHRADPAAQLPAVPQPRRRRADVAHDLRGSAALGARDQAAHRAWARAPA